MIVGVCGLGYTGSGAVLDYLKEFDDNFVIDKMEFALAYSPDGIADLEYHLMNPSRYFSSDIAIRRFKKYIKVKYTPRSGYRLATKGKFKYLTDNYINSLIHVSWKGAWSFDAVDYFVLFRKCIMPVLYRIQLLSDRLFKRFIPICPERIMYLSVCPDDFLSLTRNYVDKVLKSAGAKPDKNVVLDQPFAGDYPERSFKYFNDPVAIIVDRDPRDLYILAKKVLLSDGRFIPTDNVYKFIKYYRELRSFDKFKNDESKVLRIKFEDLVYEYEKTSQQIDAFLGLKAHTKIKQHFNPSRSINNTQLIKKYPEFNHDIKIIEENLKEFLYPFDFYKINLGKSKIF